MSRSANKRPIAVIDCETDPFKHGRLPAPFVWGFYDGVDYVTFWGEDCTERLIEFLSDKKLMIFAHNGGKFDYFFLFPYLDKTNIKIINGRISDAKIGDNIIRDSWNIIPMPLGGYKKIDIDYNKMEAENREANKAEILEYLEGDCVYLFDLVKSFVDRFGRKLTLAGVAMTELRKTLPDGIERLTTFNDSKLRPYYYGGRCQAFEIGRFQGNFKVFDINSAYPFAMLHNHPDPTFNSWDIGQTLPKNPPYFATIKAVAKGCLPFRDEKENSLTFPSDNVPRIYHVSGWEIIAGLETGALKILDVLEVRTPDKVMNFAPFVNQFYGEKKEGAAKKKAGKESGNKSQEDEGFIQELHAKLILNSSYGKFAQNALGYDDFQIVETGDWPVYTESEIAWLKENNIDLNDQDHNRVELDENMRVIHKIYTWQYESDLAPGLELYRRPAPDPNGFFNVGVAASITGFVRAYLWRSIHAAKRVLYCDTDSLICESFDGPQGVELGQWKLEASPNDVFIMGKKLYALWTGEGDADFSPYTTKEAKAMGWKMASKGVRLTPAEIARGTLTDAPITWRNDAPSYSLSRGVNFLSRTVKKT